MIELDGPIRPYAWGSRSFLAQLQGRDTPSPIPEAELWFGAHPDSPARAGDAPLDALIATDPRHWLGDGVVDRFGPRLPYLLKVLAADAPLSIQLHPDAEQARDGFARAPAAADTSTRTYTDPYGKPELLVALTPFEALCGFRDPNRTADELAGLGVPALDPVVTALRTGSVDERLRQALSLLLCWPQAERAGLVTAVAASGRPLAVRLAAQYPGDIGVAVALLLNHIRLAPGQAIFMPSGNVHAYLAGAGVEIMGASDNVMRAGLTVKHIDVAELTRLARYEVLADPIFPATPIGPGLAAWSPPVGEFRLVAATPAGSSGLTLPGEGPRLLTCVRGVASVCAGPHTLALRAGRAVFVAAEEPAVVVTGDADIYQASVG